MTTEKKIIRENRLGTHEQTTVGEVFFRGQGRPNDGADPQLNASAQDFAPYSDLRRNDMLPDLKQNNLDVAQLDTKLK